MKLTIGSWHGLEGCWLICKMLRKDDDILCCSERSERAIRHAGDIDLIVLDLKKRYHSYRADSGHHEVQDEIIIIRIKMPSYSLKTHDNLIK